MGKKLFVGNLSYNTTEGTLMDLFSQAGAVSEVEIVLDRATNRSRGFGFVTMSSNEAKPQTPRPDGGFGSGGGD